MRIKFEGEEADHHRLEAYEGIKSLEGLIRVARIATHYAAIGEVRFRAPYTDLLEAQMSQIINGSFEMLFDYVSRLSDGFASHKAKMKAEGLFNALIRRGTGQSDSDEIEIDGNKIPEGDVAAMGEAVESGLKAAHRWINKTGKKISLIDGENSVELNLTTKNYVEEEEIGSEDTRDVSVAAVNVNSKNGRVFLLDQKRTIPFIIHKEAAPRTVSNLSRYLLKYAQKKGDTVNITFRPVSHIDGRIKRLIISDCYEADDDL